MERGEGVYLQMKTSVIQKLMVFLINKSFLY